MEQEFAADQSVPVITETPGKVHGPSQAAFVLGIVACACNILLFLAAFGVILGVIAIIMGAVNRRRHRYAKAGLVLGLLSFLPVATYLFTLLAIVQTDPFLFG